MRKAGALRTIAHLNYIAKIEGSDDQKIYLSHAGTHAILRDASSMPLNGF